MARRYSDILQSARLRPALDRYVQYLEGTVTRPSRINTQGDRAAVNPVYIYPFGLDLATNQVITAYYSTARDNALVAFINAVTGLQVDTTLGASTPVERAGFRAARVVWFRNATKTKTVGTSAVTGLQYLKYAGTRLSCPFGRDDASSPADMFDGFNSVKSALRAQPNLAVNRVSLTKESFKY
jgi:gentisate 1,2-dioxygenase